LGSAERSLAARAAWLSYIGGHTQREIAEKLAISQPKAHRLIAEALRSGLVQVFVHGVPGECAAMEDELARRFRLKSCSVAPSLGPAPADLFAAIGAAAARFLHHFLGQHPEGVIGIGKGRSLVALVQHLPPLNLPGLKLIAVSGSLNRNLAANPLDVVLRLAERTGGQGYFLPVPYLAASAEEKAVLMAQKSVEALLEIGRGADLALVGIGSLEADAHTRQVGLLSEAEARELQAAGAVGDLLGRFIDASGRAVDAKANRLGMGLGPDDLTGRRVAAIAGGKPKARAILAALRTGILSDLIIDEAAASAILDILRSGKEEGHVARSQSSAA